MIYFAKEKEAIVIMVKFTYTFFNTDYRYHKNAGFSLSFGNEEEEWDDVVVSIMDTYRKYHGYESYKVPAEWLERVCAFLQEQRQLKSLSSWIYKLGNHRTEHQIALEVDGWYREINVYNLGEFGEHIHPEFEEDEKILLEFFKCIQEFLKEEGIYLSFNEVNCYEN